MGYDISTAHVVYGSDNRFAEILGVSIVSLYEKSRDMKDIIVYVLDGGIAFENKQKLKQIAVEYGRSEPVFIIAPDISELLGVSATLDRGSVSQYARFFIAQLLPEAISRVLYLDCDTMFNASLFELWSMDLEGRTVGALMDAFSSKYRANIGLSPNAIMFNSGVMLIDLVRWREHLVEEQLLHFVKNVNGKVQQGDQGVLNAVLSHDVCCFAPRFNAVTIFFDFSYPDMMVYRKPPTFYPQELIDVAVSEPVVVHFTTSFKSVRPWIDGCEHPYAVKWQTYKLLSPWCDTPLWYDTRSKNKKRLLKIYHVLPKMLGLHVIGGLQAYVRPFKTKMEMGR